MKYVCNLVLLQLAFWYLSKYDFSTCIITVLHFFFGQKPFFINEIRKETDRVQQVPILQSNRLYDCDHG